MEGNESPSEDKQKGIQPRQSEDDKFIDNHPLRSKTDTGGVVMQTSNDVVLQCEKCGKGFATTKAMDEHRNIKKKNKKNDFFWGGRREGEGSYLIRYGSVLNLAFCFCLFSGRGRNRKNKLRAPSSLSLWPPVALCSSTLFHHDSARCLGFSLFFFSGILLV